MHTFNTALVFSLIFSRNAFAQITGSYPVQITGTGNDTGVDAANISNYPACAARCDPTPSPRCGTADFLCFCGAENRSNASSCEALTCSDADYLKTAALARDACGPFYKANATLSSSVSAAIASATSAALDTVKKVDVTDLSTYPKCAQKCIPPALRAGGCSGLADRDCTCHCPIVNELAGPCELKTCSNENYQDELSQLLFIVEELCVPVGGSQPGSQASCRANATVPYGSASAGTYQPTGTQGPPITPFKGSALSTMYPQKGAVMIAAGLLVVSYLLL